MSKVEQLRLELVPIRNTSYADTELGHRATALAPRIDLEGAFSDLTSCCLYGKMLDFTSLPGSKSE